MELRRYSCCTHAFMTNGLPFSILVVEDDEDDRLFIDDAFKEIDYVNNVKKFTDGQMLLDYLEKIEPSLYPSLIVLDNTLPKLDAADLLTILKSNGNYQHIPVVVYTTSLPSSKEERLMSLGAYACFEKGTTMSSLVELVKQLRSIAQGEQ
jgi:CheY-like chemotaxis protein